MVTRSGGSNDNSHCFWRRFKNMPCPAITYLMAEDYLPYIAGGNKVRIGVKPEIE